MFKKKKKKDSDLINQKKDLINHIKIFTNNKMFNIAICELNKMGITQEKLKG